jgi:hypothetical protein
MKISQSELTFYMTRIFMADFFKAYETRDSAIKFLTNLGYDVKIERDDQGNIVDVVVEEHVAFGMELNNHD